MSTNVNKNWHLSAEVRWILVNLRDAIQHNLDLDEKGNSCDFSNHWSLLPWIWKAFNKIWCRKYYCVKKIKHSCVSYMDVPLVFVPKDLYYKMLSAYNSKVGYSDASYLNSDDLPF